MSGYVEGNMTFNISPRAGQPAVTITGFDTKLLRMTRSGFSTSI